MFDSRQLIHPLHEQSVLETPKQFNFPFYYDPHPLCIQAATEVQDYLIHQTDFHHNFGLDASQHGLAIGKMFGVMIVSSNSGDLAFLAAFSGKLAEQNFIGGFVPPIYDTLNQHGFYKMGERRLNELNAKITQLENAVSYKELKNSLKDLKLQSEKEIQQFKLKLKHDKLNRKHKREQAKIALTPQQYEVLELQLRQESISQHFQLKDLKNYWKAQIVKTELEFHRLDSVIADLKEQRKTLSANLQRKLHQQYCFLNAKGEQKDLLDIFENQPPAAAGECAAPKLFQYAYENDLKPIAMAEFWWGASPPSEVRRHKEFYPSCRGKCEPILGHMMQGLKVEPNPIDHPKPYTHKLDIIFEDDYLLLINKPPEFLSVPGKTINDSVYTRMQSYLPNATGPLLVHRLDMSTSGILLVAKNEKTYKNLQKQFINRSVKKRYVALLEGIIDQPNGVIELPLRVDLNNRPRQLVCYDHGKHGITNYEVVSIAQGRTRMYFYPLTGRTHQLRVHAAHHMGLGVPIVGDDLYGTKKDRLHLHAESIEFVHPVYKKTMQFFSEPTF